MLSTLGGAPWGPPTTDLDTWPPAPLGGPLAYTTLFCYQIKTLIDKIAHSNVLLLIVSVFKLVYLGSKVEKKVTLFCIISILVLWTHMLICSLLFLCEHLFTCKFSALMPKISKENFAEKSIIISEIFVKREIIAF